MTSIGIVGLGFMAVAHIKAYRKLNNARIAAVCNPSGKRLDGDLSDVAGNIGDQEPVKLDMTAIRAHRDFEKLIGDPDIQVVDICTPTHTHVDLVVRALEAGKHVLCEKPLARHARGAATIVRAARAADGFFMPAMCLRFWPQWAWLKKAIDSETYGRVLDARFRRVAQPPGWSPQNYLDGDRSGGALLDFHIHDVDFIQHCFGKPQSLFARGHSKISGAIDHVVAQYEVDSGAVVSAEGSWCMTEGFGFNMAYTVNFQNATADYDIARGEDALRLFARDRDPETIRCPGDDGYTGELEYFLHCVETNQPPTTVTAEDGLSVIKICEAEEESIRTGQIARL